MLVVCKGGLIFLRQTVINCCTCLSYIIAHRKVPRAQSYQDVNGTDHTNVRLALEEKEQALLASQETIQVKC